VPALHRHLGSDTTPNAFRVYFARHFLPRAKLIRDTVSNGIDPKDLNLDVSESKGIGTVSAHINPPSIEIQQFFGSDATPNGIRFQISTRFKEHVKLLKQAHSEGKDCKDVPLSTGTKDSG
jgi:hypothetical protein